MNTLQERLREVASHMTDFPMRMKTDVMREAADRIDALEAENEQLRKANTSFADRQEWWNERMFTLEAENAALRADAERYRWLRNVHAYHYTVTRYVGGATIPRFDGDSLDAAIDAAIARSKT